MQGDDANERWELPWPCLEVPSYRDARVGAWSLESNANHVAAARGTVDGGPAGGPTHVVYLSAVT